VASGGIELKSKDEIARMREASLMTWEVLELVEKGVQPGVSLLELDAIAASETKKRGGICAFLGQYGFPKSICISVNEQVVHGVPSKRKLVEGDLCKLDFGVILHGFYGDSARTIIAGKGTPENQSLVTATREALEKGIAAMKPGGRVSDIGAAIEGHVEPLGYGVVRDYVGHGIGRKLHEEPQVPNYGPANWQRTMKNPRLVPGMVLAVEPMINLGTWECETLADNWTVVTADGKWSAHWEHTIAITEDGPVVLTRP
jgi:methionyl aminopeptidase